MKIGVDIRVLMDDKYSGVSEYAANLLSAILRQTESSGDEYRLFYNSRRNLSARLNIWNGKNSKIFFTSYPNKFFNYFLQKIFSYPKLDKVVGGVDVFFSPHLNFSSFSSGKGKPKTVVTVHDLSFLRYPEFFSWRKNLWHKLLNVKKILRNADHLVAVSKSTKDDIVELIGIDENKISVISSGLNFARKNIGREESKRYFTKLGHQELEEEGYILYLGNIEPRKNITNLIVAYDLFRSELNNSGPKAPKLILAGQKGWKHKHIFRAWKKSPYRDDIIFSGYVSEEEKHILYSRARIFAYPSFYEGFGFPPLEAMAYSVPCIISNISSLPEVAGQAALMIDPNSWGEIAAAISTLCRDSILRNDLIEKGLERAKEFSWEKAAPAYIKIFKELNDKKEGQ